MNIFVKKETACFRLYFAKFHQSLWMSSILMVLKIQIVLFLWYKTKNDLTYKLDWDVMWNCSINCTEIIDIVLASSYKQFFNNWKITLNYLKLFKFRIKSTFVMKTFYMIVHHFESIRTILVRFSVYCFDATIKRQHKGALCIFVT